MIIDCDRCEVRGDACGSCVIGVLTDTHPDDRPVPYLPVDVPGLDAELPDVPVAAGGPGRRGATGGPAHGPIELAEPERRALQVLADQGLVPHLRLVPRRGPAPAGAAPLLPVPPVPARDTRHRDAG